MQQSPVTAQNSTLSSVIKSVALTERDSAPNGSANLKGPGPLHGRRPTAHARRKVDIEALTERRIMCDSHDLVQIRRICNKAFSDPDPAVGMRFLGDNWTWFETNRFVIPTLRRVLKRAPGSLEQFRTAFMSEEDRAAFDRLPNSFTVYRGGGESTARKGLSWTLAPAIAARFAQYACGHRRQMFGMGETSPVVVEAIVQKDGCLGLKLDRDEQEVVVLPGTPLQIVKTEMHLLLLE